MASHITARHGAIVEPAHERLAIAHPVTLPCRALSPQPLRAPIRADSPRGDSPDARRPPSLAGVALVAIAAASWGTWSLFLRPTHLPATVTTPIIFLVMGLVTLPVALRAPPVAWDRAALVSWSR